MTKANLTLRLKKINKVLIVKMIAPMKMNNNHLKMLNNKKAYPLRPN